MRTIEEIKEDMERAIEEIEQMQYEHRNYRSAIFKKDGIPLVYGGSIRLAVSALEKQINSGWIPVSENLPEDYVKVLTCDQKGNIHIMSHYHESKYPFYIDPQHTRYYMPIAWMLLPEPPKGLEETE